METLQRTANRGSISTGFNIDNSVKVENDNREYFRWTNFSNYASSARKKKFSMSVWVKRTEIGVQQVIWSTAANGYLSFEAADNIKWQQTYSGVQKTLNTNRVFRDTSAWYHIVLQVDTAQSTEADRTKLYINGVQETSFSSASYPSQGDEAQNLYEQHLILGEWGGGSVGFSGYIAEHYFLSEVALVPGDVGETDEDSGIWKPKAYGGTISSPSYFLEFQDSSDLGTATSGLDADTMNNISAADQATDTPTNNFTTWNTIRRYNQGTTLIKDGGTVVENNYSGGFSAVNNNIRVGKGKWYAEFEVLESGNYLMNGNVDADYIDESLNGDFYLGSLSNKKAGAGYYSSGTTGNDAIYYEGTYTSSGVTTSAGDVISVAMDCDNNKVHFAVNGSWTNSSDPANNTNGFAMTDAEQYFALASIGDKDFKSNFGGYTADTISSAATDANGYGTFEYAPPSGFYSLCTKNLAEYG